MKDIRSFFFLLLLSCSVPGQAGVLKSVVYDFDGFDLGQTDLPEGDYCYEDLTYQIAANPLGASDMLGDRVLQLNMQWNAGTGTFGRGISRFIQLDAATDMLNFYFYNPLSNPADALVDILISEDDDQNNQFFISNDDVWIKSLTISKNAGWQLLSVPLSAFSDSNTGGNGIFDASFDGGMVLLVEFRVNKNTDPNTSFYLDMVCFSEGPLPTGADILSLPALTYEGKCPLGAFEKKLPGQEHLIPADIENMFAEKRKIKYVNWFMQFSMDGFTQANAFPGSEVSTLLSSGYRPIITWEPMYDGYDRLDPVQPRLQNILNGEFDTYINAFADKIKSYNDTVVIRFMHEFEGDWYPWSITHNGHDPDKYIAVFRKVVDMFRARGAVNAKWMWCVNADYAPYENYNWIVKAYPGDNYVDIVATDIYNNHFPVNSPWWFSFRYKAAESYYYLAKYFPQKPLVICEIGCRERLNGESAFSETKAGWWARMDKELQSNFSKIKGLIFFSNPVEFPWQINSSQASLNAIEENIWKDNYYFEEILGIHDHNIDYDHGGFVIYPNPTGGVFSLEYCFHHESTEPVNIEIINSNGEVIFKKQFLQNNTCGMELMELDKSRSRGIYIINVTIGNKQESKRVILSYNEQTRSPEIMVAQISR